ncbi:KpsF/GutQ family sugar-phosphate isomerase [Rhizobium sp. KVB221]|uniref:KpsF/GutQ family sugar-phosphate isomerase n=1 Tax=Rhizobium setariae TaxID=2801340 RepID=A0A936YNU6_9HYPH|nr:KpsF/GutQ family sugar-phosphate isomerase [Rhizobium setariae]MBL0371711.1 KpsF/GutQ family sugar-phosphate isomerase [Rhizobium setariae]
MTENILKLPDSDAARSAIRTIKAEKTGLADLERALGNGLAQPFEDTVQRLVSLTGRVVVSGIGKSGHVGAKIAATFASTGTPSFFVHPVEANHGDLGMITAQDAILALSWSGETSELKGIVAYSRRFSIPLIALTSGENSTLAREADIVLCLPKSQEACPHGLAPTTSAVMQLAIGDALAVALLEARGFTAVDFKTFHPGGKLGATLAHVGDVMHHGDSLPLVSLGTPVPEAVMALSLKRFGCVGVIGEDGVLAGIVTDGDIARRLDKNLVEMKVEEIMTKNPKTVRRNTLATSAMGLLNLYNISALMVTDDDNRPIGIVHFHDLLRIGVA